MEHKGEASPQGGKGLEHREAGRWAEARSWSWTGTEAACPRTGRGQWRARLGSCWTAAIEQKRLPQSVERAGRTCSPRGGPLKEPTWGSGCPQTQGHPPNQGPSSGNTPQSESALREARGRAWPCPAGASFVQRLLLQLPVETPICGIPDFPALVLAVCES